VNSEKSKTSPRRKKLAKIPPEEKELIENELVTIADRLRKKYGLTIPESRLEIHERLHVAI
jgi:hypothetical protein